MIDRVLRLAALCSAIAMPGQTTAADIHFCWAGDGGYTMTGQMRVPDRLMTAPLITQDDVTRFKIVGFHNGERVGAWNMTQLTDETTWHLRFDPERLLFLTGGSFTTDWSQGWNADGTTSNCGAGGFGFNSGNAGQDICINGRYIAASRIAPEVAFPAQFGPVDINCGQTNLLGKGGFANQPLDGESPVP